MFLLLLNNSSITWYAEPFAQSITRLKLSILKYNIDLDPNEVNGYLKYTDDYNFLTVEKNIQNIE